MANNSVLITGASGLLGREVMRVFEFAGWEVTGTAHKRTGGLLRQIDLTDEKAVAELIEDVCPQVVINCAAERRPDACESEPEAVTRLNVGLPRQLAELSAAHGFLLIQISTDYVFDGSAPPYRVDAEPNPVNAYGRLKLAAERAVSAANPEAVILRVPILFGPTEDPTESAVTVIAANLLNSKGGSVLMDDLAIRYPTLTTDIARQLLELIESHMPGDLIEGIYHYSGSDPMTKYTMALTMAPLIGCQEEQCIPDKTPPTVPRPHDCHLDISRLQERGVFIEPTPFATAVALIL